ncbi:MAG TPA: hypothetical protein VGD97_08060 [Lacunisphaera sp.]
MNARRGRFLLRLVRAAVVLGAAWTGALPAAAVPGSGRLPSIHTFRVTGPAVIGRGASTELNWSVADATEVSVTPDVGSVTSNRVRVAPRVTTTYVLTARNRNGFVSQCRRITVTAPPSARSARRTQP